MKHGALLARDVTDRAPLGSAGGLCHGSAAGAGDYRHNAVDLDGSNDEGRLFTQRAALDRNEIRIEIRIEIRVSIDE